MVAITSGTMKRRPRVVAAAGCHWNCHPDSSRESDSLAIVDGEHQPPAGDPLQHRLDLQLGPTGLEARWSSSTRTPTVVVPAWSAPATVATVGPFGQGAHLWDG